MPTFPCDECDAKFKNMVQLKNHRLSGECKGQAASIAAAHAGPKPAYKFDFFNDGRPGDPTKNVWITPGIEGGHHSAGGLGSLGVHFLNLKDKGGVVVLKQGAPSTATEAFCAKLYGEFGVRCPSIRVLTMSDWAAVLLKMSNVPYTQPGAGDVLQNDRAKKAGGTLQNFVRGYTMKDPRTAALFQSAEAEQLLQQMGAMAAVDMLLNNFDRTPHVWDHQGNANNLMFTMLPDGPVITAIDNTTQAITNPDGLAAYLERVKTAVREARAGDKSGKGANRTRDFINQWVGVDVGAAGVEEIQRGVADTVEKIVLFKDFAGAYERTFQSFSGAGWGEAGMGQINMDFIEKVRDAMAEACE